MSHNSGFIRTIILVIIGLAILSYFGFNLRSFIESDAVQKNFGYVWNILKHVWTNYLAAPARYFWDLWIRYIWEPFLTALEKFKGGSMNPLIKNEGPMQL